ncbi:MAG: glycosyltransferase family 2 protein [Candidatus Velthaea sp.]
MMPDQAPLTFAVPFYRGEGFLREAIESVRRQESPDWRLIVCDDGASDAARDLVASYRDERMEYRRNERRLGMAGNWNRCLRGVTTEFAVLLHADDRLRREYLTVMRALIARRPRAALYFCGASIIGADGRPRFSLTDAYKALIEPKGDAVDLRGEDAVARLLHGNFIFCPTMCYRRSAIGGRVFRDDLAFVLDLDFVVGALVAGASIAGTAARAYEYRRYADNTTAQLTRGTARFEEEITYYRELETKLRAVGMRRAAAVARGKRIILLNLLFWIARDVAHANFRPALAKARLLRRLR